MYLTMPNDPNNNPDSSSVSRSNVSGVSREAGTKRMGAGGLLSPKEEDKRLTIFGRSLEWNLRYCFIDYMFDDELTIRPDLT